MLNKLMKKSIALALAAVTFGLPLMTNDALAASRNDKKVSQKVERRVERKSPAGQKVTKTNSSKAPVQNKVIKTSGNKTQMQHTAIKHDNGNNKNNDHKVIENKVIKNDNHQNNKKSDHKVINNDHRYNKDKSEHKVIKHDDHKIIKHDNHKDNQKTKIIYKEREPEVIYRPAPHRQESNDNSDKELFTGLIVGAVLGAIIANAG